MHQIWYHQVDDKWHFLQNNWRPSSANRSTWRWSTPGPPCSCGCSSKASTCTTWSQWWSFNRTHTTNCIWSSAGASPLSWRPFGLLSPLLNRPPPCKFILKNHFSLMRGVVHSKKSAYIPKKSKKSEKKIQRISRGFIIRTPYLGVNNPSVSVFKSFFIHKIPVHHKKIRKKSGKNNKKSEKTRKNPKKFNEPKEFEDLKSAHLHPIWEWTTPRFNATIERLVEWKLSWISMN